MSPNTKDMRTQLIKALLAHAQGDIQKHVANVEVYLNNPAGIGEHSNIVEAIEEELNMIAKYEDQVTVIKKHFKEQGKTKIDFLLPKQSQKDPAKIFNRKDFIKL